MLYAFQHLFLRRFVALQLVGDDHPWHEAWFFQKFAEESLRRLCVPMLLEQDIQHFPLRIPCPPQIVDLLQISLGRSSKQVKNKETSGHYNQKPS